MDTQDKSKSFAFKLATDARKHQDKKAPWQVRDGVAIAGCSGPQARADVDASGNYRGPDGGLWC